MTATMVWQVRSQQHYSCTQFHTLLCTQLEVEITNFQKNDTEKSHWKHATFQELWSQRILHAVKELWKAWTAVLFGTGCAWILPFTCSLFLVFLPSPFALLFVVSLSTLRQHLAHCTQGELQQALLSSSPLGGKEAKVCCFCLLRCACVRQFRDLEFCKNMSAK